jgi:hypothetical protein
MVGYYSAFSLAGDFEVKVNYEIIAMPAPTSGYGVSLGLTVDAQGSTGAIALVRGLSPEGKQHFTVTRAVPAATPGPEPMKYTSHSFPASGPRGRLVIRREKAEVICLASDRPTGELQELMRLPFTHGLVRYLKLHADSGGSPTRVAGRLTGVEIRAGEIAGGLTRQEAPEGWSYWWWWIPVTLTALGAAAIIRSRRRDKAPAAERPASSGRKLAARP